MCGCALSVMLLTLAVVLQTPHDYSCTFQGGYSARFTASRRALKGERRVLESEAAVPGLQPQGGLLRVWFIACFKHFNTGQNNQLKILKTFPCNQQYHLNWTAGFLCHVLPKRSYSLYPLYVHA